MRSFEDLKIELTASSYVEDGLNRVIKFNDVVRIIDEFETSLKKCGCEELLEILEESEIDADKDRVELMKHTFSRLRTMLKEYEDE